MNINKSSLWYNLAYTGAGHNEVSSSLCMFFWQAVLGILVVAWMAVMIVIVGLFLLYPALQFLIGYSTVIAALSFIVWLVVAANVRSIVIQDEVGPDWLRKEIHGRVKIDKQPSVIVEFIKAKKSKFCPTLTFTDNK